MMTTTVKLPYEFEIRLIKEKLTNMYDPYAVLQYIDEKLISPVAFKLKNTDEGKEHHYDNLPYYMRDLKIVHDIYPELFEVFCHNTAKTYFSNDIMWRHASQVVNHYVSDRYRYINSTAKSKKGFTEYLKIREMTEDQYYLEFLSRCILQEYTIIAQLIDLREPFCNKSDILRYMRHQNYIEHTAREMVTEDNVYQPM